MKDIVTFDEHLDKRYGKIGTKKVLFQELKTVIVIYNFLHYID